MIVGMRQPHGFAFWQSAFGVVKCLQELGVISTFRAVEEVLRVLGKFEVFSAGVVCLRASTYVRITRWRRSWQAVLCALGVLVRVGGEGVVCVCSDLETVACWHRI